MAYSSAYAPVPSPQGGEGHVVFEIRCSYPQVKTCGYSQLAPVGAI